MADKKKAATEEAEPVTTDVLRVAGHPRAAGSVRTIKGWAGLAGFVVTFWLSWNAGSPFYWTSLRAVVGGIVCYLVAWACALTVWRNILLAEVEAARVKKLEEIENEPDPPAVADGVAA